VTLEEQSVSGGLVLSCFLPMVSKKGGFDIDIEKRGNQKELAGKGAEHGGLQLLSKATNNTKKTRGREQKESKPSEISLQRGRAHPDSTSRL